MEFMKHLFLFLGLFLVEAISAQTTIERQSSASNFKQEMTTIMNNMNHDMSSNLMTGDVDYDFAVMMIPHHNGAIEMAKAELMYGKDPLMRRLAQEILVEQQSEIDIMNLWLKKHSEQK